MKYYFEDNSMIFKLEGKLHERIILYSSNYRNHIKVKHTEITMKKIEEILKEPDYIYKPSKSSKDFYYEKNIGLETYRVVISDYKKHVKCVITAYNVKEEGSLFEKISSNNKETARLIRLRDNLLPKLMSGEIRVPINN